MLITIASFALVGDAITRNLIAYAISENNRLNFLTKKCVINVQTRDVQYAFVKFAGEEGYTVIVIHNK